jgi:hypothetical protein
VLERNLEGADGGLYVGFELRRAARVEALLRGRVPEGLEGIVFDSKVFTRKGGE